MSDDATTEQLKQLLEQRIVFFDGAQHVGDGHPVAGNLQCARGANIGAVAATVAAASVDDDTTIISNAKRLLQTDREASIAVIGPDAAVAGLNELDLPRTAFGVGAPHAGERAALEKDDGADPGPVVKRELLNVEHQAFGRLVQNSCSVLRMISFWRAGVRSTK